MTAHLSQTTAFAMQDGLLGEIEGEGAPYLHKYVHDVPTFWDWMRSSFTSAHFKNDLQVWPYPGRVASYNQIVGGVQLSRLSSEPETCSQSSALASFYDTKFGGRCHKTSAETYDSAFLFYHENNQHILDQLQNLSDSGWIDQNSTNLDIGILFYNAHLGAFTAHHLTFHFQPNGVVRILFSMETYLADPYNNILWIIPDIIFGLIILRMLYSELLELVPACMNGLDGFLQYMAFWNVIDWLSIFCGIGVMTMWGLICVKVSGDLQDTITKLDTGTLDDAVLRNSTFLSPEELDAVLPRYHLEEGTAYLHALMDEIAVLHENCRKLTFLYTFVLMMKFFKAFQANPRLNIVIKTMQTSAVDIIHFLIVFLVIFFVFSSASYVYFGGKIKDFSTQLRSMMMCWRILMGEFDVAAMEAVDQGIAYIWMLIFQFLVLLILLNMLLAIIMDTYAAVNQPGALTIWAQVQAAVRTKRETRGHLDMWYLICEFEDEDYQAHPGDRVTSKSLRRAFEAQKMTKHNADYLVKRTAEYVKAKDSFLEVKLTDALRIISRMQTTVLRTQEAAEQTLEMLKEERRRPQEARFNAIMAGQDPDNQQPSPQQQGFPALPGAVPANAVSPHKALGNSVTSLATLGGSNFVQTSTSTAVLRSSLHGADFGAGGQAEIVPRRRGSAVMSMANPNDPLLEHVGQLQETLAAVREDHARSERALMEELQNVRQHMEQRDSWLEQRLNALDRRCEKVERASDRVTASLQGFNFSDLMDSIRRITLEQQSAPHQRGPLQLSGQLPGQLEGNGSNAETSAAHPGETSTVAWGPAGTFGGGAAARVERQLEQLSEQVQQLLAHAEESAEMRRLLWKIDLNFRQMRNGQGPPQEPPSKPSTSRASLSDGFAKAAGMRRSGGATAGSSSGTPVAGQLSQTAGSGLAGSRLPSVPGQ